ncbi:hypothetical protein Tco_1309915 [Tanacetum coccineum]
MIWFYANGYLSQWDQFTEQVEPITSAVPYNVIWERRHATREVLMKFLIEVIWDPKQSCSSNKQIQTTFNKKFDGYQFADVVTLSGKYEGGHIAKKSFNAEVVYDAGDLFHFKKRIFIIRIQMSNAKEASLSNVTQLSSGKVFYTHEEFLRFPIKSIDEIRDVKKCWPLLSRRDDH